MRCFVRKLQCQAQKIKCESRPFSCNPSSALQFGESSNLESLSLKLLPQFTSEHPCRAHRQIDMTQQSYPYTMTQRLALTCSAAQILTFERWTKDFRQENDFCRGAMLLCYLRKWLGENAHPVFFLPFSIPIWEMDQSDWEKRSWRNVILWVNQIFFKIIKIIKKKKKDMLLLQRACRIFCSTVSSLGSGFLLLAAWQLVHMLYNSL